MEFRNKEHEERYKTILRKAKQSDCYHSAVAYLLALDNVCYEHQNEIFDFEEDCIKPESVQTAWQTDSSQKTTRLIFNLWNGFCYDSEDSESVSLYYAPDSIFTCCYAPYYFEAIKLRYPEYMQSESCKQKPELTYVNAREVYLKTYIRTHSEM